MRAGLPLALLLAGCGPTPLPAPAAGTQVDLNRGNYRVIRSNVTGESWGVSLLGFIPIVSPSSTAAMTALYENAGGLESGKPQALVNVVQETNQLYLVVVSLPRLMVRADIIEFTAP
jgi:hypothetical protein